LEDHKGSWEMQMRANIGSTFLIVVGLFFGSAAWGQDVAKMEKPTTMSSDTTREFSSSKVSQLSLDLVASANAGPLANPEPLAAASPIMAMPVIATKKSDATVKNEARNKKFWYSLAAVNHGAAAFDAWSTRSAVQRGGQELNPLLKPFANSDAIYATIQVVPFGMDYLGRRMMRSHNPVLRKIWWLPQTASTALSLAAGVHNMGVSSR
jgi:hypothetical protein